MCVCGAAQQVQIFPPRGNLGRFSSHLINLRVSVFRGCQLFIGFIKTIFLVVLVVRASMKKKTE